MVTHLLHFKSLTNSIFLLVNQLPYVQMNNMAMKLHTVILKFCSHMFSPCPTVFMSDCSFMSCKASVRALGPFSGCTD